MVKITMSSAQGLASTSWRGRGTTKWLSETLKIQAVGAGFLAKSNLCSSEAELEGLLRDIKLLFFPLG